MDEKQKKALKLALEAVSVAFEVGVDPDVLMDNIIRISMDLGLVAGINKKEQ